jgi:hypothetical protein
VGDWFWGVVFLSVCPCVMQGIWILTVDQIASVKTYDPSSNKKVTQDAPEINALNATVRRHFVN